MSVIISDYQISSIFAINVFLVMPKAKSDLYLVPNSSDETFQWNPKFTVFEVSNFCFNVPTPSFTVLDPIGFRVTYIGMPYYKEVLFACNINRPFPKLEQGKVFKGDVSWDITPEPTNRSLFIYEDPFHKLFVGDVLYYWTRVTLKDKRWFFKMYQNHTVTKEDFEKK